ncbi:hypothetical protein DLD77_07215 [Chitinophaga alhagiae]|uniref:GLPGLI family protein n=1 Tax=Chitinophaga alhagiae TaxID=2203219 RepID=A0ABM6WC75_9BACT|nr:GLPGLI family protein [Chitinophaga alhagiae]AWO01496.1 hypothetical protein DLD77_07215 [Chitinophaga alhagiae]
MKILLYALLGAALPAAAQQTSGVIEYEMTARIEPGQMKIVRFGPGGAPLPADAPMPELPDLMTTKQTLFFSGSKAKIESEAMTANVMVTSTGGAQGQTVTAGGGMPSLAVGGPGTMKRPALRPPVSNTMYIDLAERKYLSVTEEKKDSTVVGRWYTEEPYKQSGEFRTSGKTKTIAGYKCRRATVKVGDESFVVWYTEEIPVLFSPVNGVLPEKGVVLSIESSKRSYVAKKVTLQPVPEASVSLPAGAEKVTPAELKEKRRQIIEKFHNEQLKKFQEAEGRP